MAGSGTAHLRSADETLLRVENLVVDFPAGRGRKVSAVSNVSLDISAGETLGLVGESGCGKSTVALAVMRDLGVNGRIVGGTIKFKGRDLTAMNQEELRQIRGSEIAHSELMPRMVLALDTGGVGPRADYELVVAAFVDGGGDAAEHELGGHDLLAVEMAAALGVDLVLEVAAGDAGVLELGDGAGGGHGLAEAGVGVDKHGQVGDPGDLPRAVRDLRQGGQADVRQGEVGGDDGAGDVHAVEAGLLDGARHQRGEGAGEALDLPGGQSVTECFPTLRRRHRGAVQAGHLRTAPCPRSGPGR